MILPLPAHRPVEALQVAVDHHHQVVQLLPAGDVDGAQNLWSSASPSPMKAQILPSARLLQPAAFQILGEPRLIDGAGCRKAHAGRGHRPKPRQAARMRIGGQAAAFRRARGGSSAVAPPSGGPPSRRGHRLRGRCGPENALGPLRRERPQPETHGSGPTSIMVAADKYVAMWPPTPEPLSNAAAPSPRRSSG